jgi:hypothetical protein
MLIIADSTAPNRFNVGSEAIVRRSLMDSFPDVLI